MISVCSLIYRSTKYADAVWNSFHEFTTGARFFFVANDASKEVIDHLKAKGYPFVENRNEIQGLDGYDPPLYMRSVYMGWNRALRESDEIAVLVNSDNMFSPGWLEGLTMFLGHKTIVTSKLVERDHPKHGKFFSAIEGNFGDHPNRYKKSDFLFLASNHRNRQTEDGGAYMPCAVYKETAMNAGLYPEGNPPGSYGDKEFFKRLELNGVRHLTSLESIVYHFKEGEMSE